MEQIRIKVLTGIGASDGEWEIVGFDEFLMRHSPGLAMRVYCTKQFPPLHILNEELMSGGADLGMSGGCFWKPFKISEQQYLELSEEMLSSPEYDLEYDKSLEDRLTLKKWCGAVLTKHNPRNK